MLTLNKNNILKFLFICACCFGVIGCSYNVTNDIKWNTVTLVKATKTYEKKIDWNKVKVGDILIKECDGGFLGWFGHCSVVVSEDTTVEIPKLGEKVYFRKLDDWKEMRRVAVLRYKNMDETFKYYLFREIRETVGKPYLIVPKESDDGYYCSQFIWYLFNKTGKKLGRDIDLDSDGGFFVWPWDMFHAKDIEIIDVMN